MKFTLKHGDLEKQRNGTLLLAVSETGELTATGKKLDKTSQGFLKKLIKRGEIKGTLGETLPIHHIPHSSLEKVILIGTGKSLTVSEKDYRRLAFAGIKAVLASPSQEVTSALTELTIKDQSQEWKVQQTVEVFTSAMYNFDEFKSKKKPKIALKEIIIGIDNKKAQASCDKAMKQGKIIADAVSYTKDIANLPSNICNPSYLADAAKKLAKEHKSITVKVLEEKDMQKLGMGAFLAVTKGSDDDAKLVCIEYKGGKGKEVPVALVGKGITFDTGGLSLKPADAMVGMKYDMCGAASVLGTLHAAARLKLPINVVGILAAAENMPSGHATKPEDIVTTMSGQTVEIMNTDAEGRLVLCDALTYVERFKPEVVIDIATLTGAVVIALGHHATGLLSNDDDLAKDLLQAGIQSHDRAWQLPLWDEYQDLLKSPFADMSNVGGRAAGTITAACFLSRFAKKFKWAHLDVAGTAAMMGGNDRYATGRPVPMLTQYLINVAANK